MNMADRFWFTVIDISTSCMLPHRRLLHRGQKHLQILACLRSKQPPLPDQLPLAALVLFVAHHQAARRHQCRTSAPVCLGTHSQALSHPQLVQRAHRKSRLVLLYGTCSTVGTRLNVGLRPLHERILQR